MQFKTLHPNLHPTLNLYCYLHLIEGGVQWCSESRKVIMCVRLCAHALGHAQGTSLIYCTPRAPAHGPALPCLQT